MLPLLTIVRDFIRRIRLARHVASNGWRFEFHGLEVEIPEGTDSAVANALIRGKYEAEEAEFISKYLPPDRPVIELGGSLGIVSSLIGSLLDTDTPHVIIEANAALIELCAQNAGRAASQVYCKALSYDGPTALFVVKSNPHTSRLSVLRKSGANIMEVDAVTLSDLWRDLGAPDGFTLISDIEGAEVALLEQDIKTVSNAGLVIMELHPSLIENGSSLVEQIKTTMTEAEFFLVEKKSDVYVWRKCKQPHLTGPM